MCIWRVKKNITERKMCQIRKLNEVSYSFSAVLIPSDVSPSRQNIRDDTKWCSDKTVYIRWLWTQHNCIDHNHMRHEMSFPFTHTAKAMQQNRFYFVFRVGLLWNTFFRYCCFIRKKHINELKAIQTWNKIHFFVVVFLR